MVCYIYKIVLTEGSLKDFYYIGQRCYRGDDITKDKYKGSGDIVKKYYKKYPNGFVKEILEICEFDELDFCEDKWLGDKYEYDPMCLNLVAGGKGGFISRKVYDRFKIKYKGHFVSEETRKKIGDKNRGRKASEETKMKMSAVRKGKKFPNRNFHGSNNPRSKKVWQFDIHGNLIKIWECCKDAKIHLNANAAGAALKLRMSVGFFWLYEKDLDKSPWANYTPRNPKPKKEKSKFPHARSPKELQTIIDEDSFAAKCSKSNTRSKVTLQFDLDGNLIEEWSSVGIAAKHYKMTRSNIHRCCQGKCKTAGGYIWKYKNETI